MATYNGAKYLQEQIDSILNQTIQDFELVVCDDCSQDETYDILQDYASKDRRIRIYENESNLGFKRNFAKAVALCKGEYIALSDQDDIWMPEHLELLLRAIKNKVLSCGNALLVNGNGESMGMTWREQQAFESVPETDLGKAMSILLFRNPYQGAAMMIKNSLLEYALPIPQTMKYHDTWFAILACFNGGIACFDTPILKYRRIEESVTGLRKTKISRFNQYRSHFIWGDKLDTIRCVYDRLPNLSEKERKFLKKMEKICVRNKTFIGKWLNFAFTTIHYKTIYNSTFNSWK